MPSPLLNISPDPNVPYSRPMTPVISPKLGFIGIGAMGYSMSRNLAKKNLEVPGGASPLLVWNRTTSRAEKLVEELGEKTVAIAQSVEQIATECDIIFTNLGTDSAVKAVYEKFATALHSHPLGKKKIFVETSTIYPLLAGELDALISDIPHSHFVVAPVFGTPDIATQAQLLIAMSGDYQSKKEIAPYLVPAVGRKIIDLGGNVEKASTFKLVGNSLILGTIEIMSEAYTLAEKSGIGADNMNTIVKEIFPAPDLIAISERMAHDNFDGKTGFSVEGALKDANHIRRLTSYYNSPMPALDVAQQHLITAKATHNTSKAQGHQVPEPLDWTGVLAATRVAAGLDPFDSRKHTGIVQVEEESD